MNNFYVYVHARPNGTPFYVGKGTGIRALKFHARNKYHKNIVAKHGKANIIVKIVNDSLAEACANVLEIETIAACRKFGWVLANMTDGGEGSSGMVHSPATRKKIGDSHRGKKRTPFSAETRAKMSAALLGNTYNLGRKHTDDAKANMSGSQMGNTKFLGRKHTLETKARISSALLGKPKSAEHRAKNSAVHIGQKPTAETRERMCVAQRARFANVALIFAIAR